MTTASQDGAAAGPPKRPDLKAVEASGAKPAREQPPSNRPPGPQRNPRPRPRRPRHRRTEPPRAPSPGTTPRFSASRCSCSAPRGGGGISLHARRRPVPFRGRLLDPLGRSRRRDRRDPRRAHPGQRRLGVGFRHPLRIHPQPADGRTRRRRSRPQTDLQPARGGSGLHPGRGRHDRGSDRLLGAHDRHALRGQHRHHRPARQRLHARGRPGDRGGDPDGIERAGEPPVRTGARATRSATPRRISARPRRA